MVEIRAKSSSRGRRRRAPWWLFALAAGFAGAAHAWTVESAPDPLTEQQRCLLRSATQTINDGYSQTPTTLTFNGQTLLLITKSEIDASFADLALVVDDKPFAASARVVKKTLLAFDADPPTLVEQFKAGAQATVYVRFWPTWPATERIPVQFTLKGFTKAYGDFERCRQNNAQTRRIDAPAAPPLAGAGNDVSAAATRWESP